jgi:hypothetical protein
VSELTADRRYQVGVVVGAIAVMIAILWFRFDEDFEATLPPVPAKPAPASQAAVRNTDYSPEMFAAYLAKDAETFGTAPPDLGKLDEPLAYELAQPRQALPPGGAPFQTRTLRISSRVAPLTAQTSSGSYRAEHLILTIENVTDQHLAYRVVTLPGIEAARCLLKQDLPHNALALKPHETIERTECIFKHGQKPILESAETLVLSDLAYHYASRLYPPHIGLEQRTARGHKPPKGEACTYIPEQGIRLGMQKGQVTWRDILDFYSRHRCDTYMFPIGYRAIQRKGERTLPVSPRDVGPPG